MQSPRSHKPHIGAVLVGGRSIRFGSPKALAEVGTRTMFERVLAACRTVLPSVVLVTAAGQRERDRHLLAGSPSHGLNGALADQSERVPVEIVSDVFPAAGPLGGVHAALLAARARSAVGACVCACDAPFVEGSLLRALVTFSDEHDAVIPVTRRPDRLQPLFAWYSSDLVERIEENIRRGRLALHRFIADLPRVKYLPVEEIPLRRPPEIVFMNVNTPADLETARRAIEEYPDES